MEHRTKNNQSTKYVIRIDSDSTHGFQTRIPVGGRQVTKFFSDGVYGGKRKSKKAAIEYRDKECRRLKIDFHKTRVIHRRDRRNTSGMVGVSRIRTRRGNAMIDMFVASWTPKPGEGQKRKSFSVKMYGERKARKLARDYRRQKEREILGVAA